jgi:hypothetical protein
MFKFLKNEKKPETVENVLEYVKELEKEVSRLSGEIDKLKKDSIFFTKKAEVERYNPFPGTGGNQSFSVAMLDGNKDGVIITSIYGRDGNRIYAKPIKAGISEYSLSDEEKKLIIK